MLRKLFGTAVMILSVVTFIGTRFVGSALNAPAAPVNTVMTPEGVVTAFCNGYGSANGSTWQVEPDTTPDLYQKGYQISVQLIKALANQIVAFKEDESRGQSDPVARVTGGELENPLTSGFYDGMPSLFGYYHLEEEVDALLAALEQSSDRLLELAQNLPDDFTVDPGRVLGNQATVIVHATWNGNPEIHTLQMTLERASETWVITDVSVLN